MPVINVSLKEGHSKEKLEAAKQSITDQGGKITKEFKLIDGFTAEIPDDKLSTLESHEGVDVEKDQVVTTQ
ncbi:hypothetical protein EJ05DRAFT_498504 [Pseudovirgaria hyperparasitica]|uniref:Inhibitor I9 domain-containing protein n=1 Tax=Pseudovirgaria hyperparasitica TaxID=470096 RepID=A0A6A6WCW3_9PEZI|nr:uncharacterized protein EJ05DRAFT_498504 [Pseudovirgaria hyperparasitica]KAF2760543.1 hypothetical protein EJ05DRAFT_498504 [Pseudovirgaria hyperparasitica]